VAVAAEEEGRRSFLKKRTKKLLFLRARPVTGDGHPMGSCGEIKVFCFFSSEKKSLSFSFLMV
jgi:hypothetical protein